jgi:hypothetical protein
MFKEEIQMGIRHVILTSVLSMGLPLIFGIKDPTSIAVVSGSIWFVYTIVFIAITFLIAEGESEEPAERGKE